MAAEVAPPPPPPPPPPAPALQKCESSTALNNASLYVGDLHPEVTEMELAQTFREMGTLLSVRLCRDRVSHKSLRYAYINFFTSSDASKAMACLNHTELMGKPMRIMWCQRNPLPRKTGEANLFVKNLDPSVTSFRLDSIFCKYGTVLSCKVAGEDGKSKGFGFVQFVSEDSAMAAINDLHGTILEGKKLYVSKFVKKSEKKDAHEETKFTNLYVNNLSEDVTEDLLRDTFSEFGKVSSFVIMKDAEGKSRGFGFVNFKLHEEAKKAVEVLNGALLGSKKLFVGKAQKKAEREELLRHDHEEKLMNNQKSKASNLYVKNLTSLIDDKKLGEHFSVFGEVTSAKVVRHDNGISKGFGFVSFSTPEGAKKALDTLNGSIFQGKSLYVGIAQRKEERLKKLQNYHAPFPLQSFYSSYPPFIPPHQNFPLYSPNTVSYIDSYQPVMYQRFTRNAGALYPYAAQNYQGNDSTYIPMKQSQQKNSVGFVYQPHALRNASLKTGNSYSKGVLATRGFAATSSIRSCKENIGKLVHHHVENIHPKSAEKITGRLLKMKECDLVRLLNSPKSLAMQVEKAVQMLKEENSRCGVKNVGLPVKSARCLSY